MKYRNISITFNAHIETYELFEQGDSGFNFPSEVVKEAMESCGEIIKFLRFQDDSLTNKGLRKKLDSNYWFSCTHPDAAIFILSYMFNQEDEEFGIEYVGDYFWMFHDFRHAHYQTASCSFMTSADNEDDAHKHALEQLAERDMPLHEHITIGELENYGEIFYRRFGRQSKYDLYYLFLCSVDEEFLEEIEEE